MHATTDGARRGHSSAARLARAVARDEIRAQRIAWPWRPAEQLAEEAVKHLLQRLGSPRVAEGRDHAWLRVIGYTITTAIAAANDHIAWEATTVLDRRPDLLVIDSHGVGRLGVECGSVPGDNLIDHFAVGMPHVLVLGFGALAVGPGITGWLFSSGSAPPLGLPTTNRLRAAFADVEALSEPGPARLA